MIMEEYWIHTLYFWYVLNTYFLSFSMNTCLSLARNSTSPARSVNKLIIRLHLHKPLLEKTIVWALKSWTWLKGPAPWRMGITKKLSNPSTAVMVMTMLVNDTQSNCKYINDHVNQRYTIKLWMRYQITNHNTCFSLNANHMSSSDIIVTYMSFKSVNWSSM